MMEVDSSFVEREQMAPRLAGLMILAGFAPPDGAAPFTRIELPGLPNVVEVHAKVLSGGQPEGEAAFARLAAFGVKTIISVDGVQPDVETARKYGLRYIHLPHGYDGVSDVRAMQLSKAVRDLPGRIYIHCHHGRHRSPAAAAVACVGAGLLDASRAEAVLRTAGTGSQYLGLFDAARGSRRFDDATLDRLQVDFREIVALPPLAKTMVEIDSLSDVLGKFAGAGWKKPRPNEKPASHTALVLREQYRELLRDPAIAQKPPTFQRMLQNAEAAAADLGAVLNQQAEKRDETISAQWKNVQRSCAACHARFRDVPQGPGAPRKPRVQRPIKSSQELHP